MLFKCKQCPLDVHTDSRIQCVSVCLIALLVFATVIITTILALNPIIILNIAQLNTGQRDFVLKPQMQFFNTTKLAKLLPLLPMPRLKANLTIGNGKSVCGWFLDFNLEENQGLGTFNAKMPPNHRFLYAHKSLGLAEGAQVYVQFQSNTTLALILQLVENQTLKFDQKEQLLEEAQALSKRNEFLGGTFTVKENFDDPKGKMSSVQSDGCILMDISIALQQMVQQTLGSKSAFMQLLNQTSFKMGDIASEATINLPNRINIYSNADSEAVMKAIQSYGQRISASIGYFAVKISMPIADKLQLLQYFGMLIGVMLKSIIASLFLLSVLMLDSTIQIGIDKQKVELAILKVVGANRMHVAMHILGGAIKQVLFANIVAYPMIYFAYGAIQSFVRSYIADQVTLTFTFEACLAGVIIGFLVPIIASVSPISSIIGNDLAESLGQNRPNYSEVKTQIYVQGKEFPWGKVTFGILATAYGLAIYYLLPKSMINQNLGLMITLFFVFLEGLLIGLVILSYSFQYILQGAMAKILLFWTSPISYALTIKNLSCHRLQNRKTSLLYALAVSFIIMIAVGFQLQIDSSKNEFLNYMGGDIDVGGDIINPIFFNNLMAKLPSIDSLTYMSDALQTYLRKEGGRRVMISDKAKLFFLNDQIFGIGGPLIPRSQQNGREVKYTDSHPPYNIYTYLNTEAGLNTCIIGEYSANKMGILASPNHQFYINIYYEDRVKRVPINYSTVLSKRKVLHYTAYAFPDSQLTVSFQTYRQLAGLSTIDQVPIFRAKFYVKNYSMLPEIVSIIRKQVKNNTEFPQSVDFVWNRQEADKTFGELKQIVETIMTTLLILVLVLCFFSLLTTTHAKIASQEKEIGVLLVLGYQKGNILRVYIYEAFVLVANSCCKGLVAGYTVALMMAWQRELFSSVTVDLPFNIQYVIIIFVMAIASSLLATYRELNHTLNRPISGLLSSN